MLERLAAAVSTRYRIEREIGAVGMTTVYVMPYVEGESLRDHLQREKQLLTDHGVHRSWGQSP